MSLPRAACLLTVVTVLVGTIGCNSYQYLRDPTPQIEQMRYEYVRNNPGNKFNNDILVGRVKPGMSRLQVRVCWGEPDQVAAAERMGVDQVWSYAENEPSRGTSVYNLMFEGELLKTVEVSRDALIMGTARAQNSFTPPDDAPLGSGNQTSKRIP